jgi:hypothetical protein
MELALVTCFLLDNSTLLGICRHTRLCLIRCCFQNIQSDMACEVHRGHHNRIQESRDESTFSYHMVRFRWSSTLQARTVEQGSWVDSTRSCLHTCFVLEMCFLDHTNVLRYRGHCIQSWSLDACLRIDHLDKSIANHLGSRSLARMETPRPLQRENRNSIVYPEASFHRQ